MSAEAVRVGMSPLEGALMRAKPDAGGRRMASLPLREGARLFAVFGEDAFIQVYVQIDRPSFRVQHGIEDVPLTARLVGWRPYAALEGWLV